MISLPISDMIKDMINPDGGGAETRYFIDLDSVLNSYYLYVTPVSFTGDFEHSIKGVLPALGGYLFSDNTVTTGEDRLAYDAAGKIWMTIGGTDSNSLDGDVTPYIDGKLHLVLWKRVGTLVTVSIDGVIIFSTNVSGTLLIKAIGAPRGAVTGIPYFDGILANPSTSDNSGAPVTTTFKLDRPTGNTEVSVEGNNTLTYVNIPESNIELYTLTDDGWENNNTFIVNGEFETDTDWAKGAGWSIAGGQALIDEVSSAVMSQSSGRAKTYKLYVDVDYVNSGAVQFYDGSSYSTTISSQGMSINIINNANESYGFFAFRSVSNTDIAINSIQAYSLIEVA